MVLSRAYHPTALAYMKDLMGFLPEAGEGWLLTEREADTLGRLCLAAGVEVLDGLPVRDLQGRPDREPLDYEVFIDGDGSALITPLSIIAAGLLDIFPGATRAVDLRAVQGDLEGLRGVWRDGTADYWHELEMGGQ